MDMTRLMDDPTLDPLSLVNDFIEHFSRDVADRLARMHQA
jgi:hypothetical protein